MAFTNSVVTRPIFVNGLSPSYPPKYSLIFFVIIALFLTGDVIIAKRNGSYS